MNVVSTYVEWFIFRFFKACSTILVLGATVSVRIGPVDLNLRNADFSAWVKFSSANSSWTLINPDSKSGEWIGKAN